MFNLTLLAVGKMKEPHWRAGAEEYLKRLRPYAKVEVFEVKAEAFGESNKKEAKKKEGEKILEFLSKRSVSRIFLLDEGGKEFASAEFAAFLDKSGGEELIFVIGGTLGIDEAVKSRYPNNISLSRMTLPHELARVVFIEQVYRAATILKNKKYHY